MLNIKATTIDGLDFLNGIFIITFIILILIIAIKIIPMLATKINSKKVTFTIVYEKKGNNGVIFEEERKTFDLIYMPPPLLRKNYFFIKVKDEDGKEIQYNSRFIKMMEFHD